jgi:hypothetical protein
MERAYRRLGKVDCSDGSYSDRRVHAGPIPAYHYVQLALSYDRLWVTAFSCLALHTRKEHAVEQNFGMAAADALMLCNLLSECFVSSCVGRFNFIRVFKWQMYSIV